MSGLFPFSILVTCGRECLYDVVQNPLFACRLVVSRTCGPSKYPKHSKESVIIRNCCKEIKGHLRSLNTFDSDLKSEGKLILARALTFVYIYLRVRDCSECFTEK